MAVLGSLFIAGYIAVRLAEDDPAVDETSATIAAAQVSGHAQLMIALHYAEGLVDATWTGTQDLKCLVEVKDRGSGDVVSCAESKVVHDGGTRPVWTGQRGLVCVALPPEAAPPTLKLVVTVYSECYTSQNISLGHAETVLEDLHSLSARTLEIDPCGKIVLSVSYRPPLALGAAPGLGGSHAPLAHLAPAASPSAECVVVEDESCYGTELEDVVPAAIAVSAAPPVRALRVASASSSGAPTVVADAYGDAHGAQLPYAESFGSLDDLDLDHHLAAGRRQSQSQSDAPSE